MTISNITDRTSVVGSATAGQVIPFTFPITNTTDIVVKTRVITTGVETTLALTTDYSVTITGITGGSVTLVASCPATNQVHVLRDTPKTQTLNMTLGGAFNPELQESAFDKATKQVIEGSVRLSRAIRQPDTDVAGVMTLPSSIDRASKYLAFDASGGVITSAGPRGDTAIPVSAFAETLLDDVSATTALATLGLTVSTFGKTLIDDTTAAAARTTLDAEKKFQFNVKDYGAVGGLGMIDDTVAIQTALTAATGSTLFIPDGTYKTTAVLNIPPRTSIIGSGWNCVIRPDGCDGLSFDISNYVSPIIISNFWLYGDGNTHTAIKVMGGPSTASKTTGITFDNLYISWFETAMYFRAMWSSRIYGCYLINNWNGVKFIGQDVGNRIESTEIVLGSATGTGTSTGIFVDSAFDYDPTGNTQHRPEHVVIDKSIIYGFDIGVDFERFLFATIINSVVDSKSIGIKYNQTSGGLTIRDNYIQLGIAAGGLYGIQGTALGTATNTVCLISHNYIFAIDPDNASRGIYIMTSNNGVVIEYNYLEGFLEYDILLDAVDNGKVLYNTCKTGGTSLQVLNGTDYANPTIVSGNVTAGLVILGGNYIRHDTLVGSDTWNAASIPDGDEEVKEVTVTGAALGDFVTVSMSIDIADLTLTAQVTATDTVTCQLSNNTGGAIDLASGTVYVRVGKK